MADPQFHTKTGPKTLEQLAAVSGATLHDGADKSFSVNDVAPLNTAQSNQISFLDNIKYKDEFKATKAGACIVSPKLIDSAPEGIQLLVSSNPYKSYALIAQVFYPENYPEANISDHASVDPSATIGDGCIIEAGVVIGNNANIGAGSWIGANAVIGESVILGQTCRIGANATVSHTQAGDNVRIYPGACVGQDGFGFAIDPAGHVKVPQLGRVIIGDNAEIGSNTCIDRGAGPDTVIGAGAWIDNLVQIAHNVKIGKGCIIIAGAGIAGSAVIEDYAVIAGQAGVAGHVTVGMGAQVGAQAGIISNVPAGEKMLGSPAFPIRERMRHVATLKKISSKD